METSKLSFIAEWYDAQSGIVKSFFLNYYPDKTLELIDRGNQKTFLKKIMYGDITEKNLYVGAVVNIYSRQMNLVDYANEYTKKMMESRCRVVVVLIHEYQRIGKVISSLEKSSITISNLKMIKITRQHHEKIQQLVKTPRKIEDIQGVVVAVQVVAAPKSLQLIPELEEGCQMLEESEVAEFIFEKEVFPTTATFDQCSLCIIRPLIVKEGNAGKIIHEIISNGYHVSAVTMVHLDTAIASEFLEVYKGVVKHYSELVRSMSSGPCIALEITGDDIVNRFREFCGPFDVEVAKVLQPESIRARYGKNNILNAVHCTECPEDGSFDVQHFFSILPI